jgi:hypothetical protein
MTGRMAGKIVRGVALAGKMGTAYFPGLSSSSFKII